MPCYLLKDWRQESHASPGVMEVGYYRNKEIWVKFCPDMCVHGLQMYLHDPRVELPMWVPSSFLGVRVHHPKAQEWSIEESTQDVAVTQQIFAECFHQYGML